MTHLQSIWYQVDQCHWLHREKLGSVRKTMRSFDSNKRQLFSTSCLLQLNDERKAFHRTFSPSSISFNENAIVRNFYPKKFQTRKLFKDSSPTWREFAYFCILLIIEPRSTCSRAYHSDYSVSEPINCSTVYYLFQILQAISTACS